MFVSGGFGTCAREREARRGIRVFFSLVRLVFVSPLCDFCVTEKWPVSGGLAIILSITKE